MEVSLSPEIESIIKAKAATEFFEDASDVVSRAVKMLDEELSFELAAAIEKGKKSIQEGRIVPYDMAAIEAEAMRDRAVNKPINPDVLP